MRPSPGPGALQEADHRRQVVYSDRVAEAVDRRFVENLGDLMRRLASEMPARWGPARRTALNARRRSLREVPL